MTQITEEKVKEILNKVLLNESSKIKREEYNRIQFKLDELENSLIETIKELRQLNDSIPLSLKIVTGNKINSIGMSLNSAEKIILQLKEKIRLHKKNLYSQSIEVPDKA